jgi:hypothetical protein
VESIAENVSATRRSLHAVAELLMAGPQYRKSGTIRLRVSPGGFETVAEPALRVDGDVLYSGGLEFVLSGALDGGGPSYARLATAAGIDIGAPEGLYRDGSGVAADDEILIDKAAAIALLESFVVGDAALRAFDPDSEPVLWPEHFDLGITVAEVNYGVSLGDSSLDEPYAYVGPWRPRSGEFWNVSFGAARSLRELGGVDQAVAFFAEGQQLAAEDR